MSHNPDQVRHASSSTSREVEAYLDAVIGASRDVLGGGFVGVYAAGSLALNAFQADRSDIDIAVLCRDELVDEVKRELVRRVRHDALACPARGLELVVYTVGAARSGSAEPAYQVELNDGPAMAFRQFLRPSDRPATDGTFWYGLDRSILHQSGWTLAGPPASEVFAELGSADVRRLLIESLRWWMALPTPAGEEPAVGADDAVLGACRALVRDRHGIWLAKVEAGRHLLTAGHRSVEVIQRSIGARAGGLPPSGLQARAFQQTVLHEIIARNGAAGQRG